MLREQGHEAVDGMIRMSDAIDHTDRMWWVGRTVSVPESIAACLAQLLGAPVSHVQIIEHSWFVRCHGRAIATTRRRRIYLRGSAGEFFADPWLMLHEYWHVIKQWETRSLTVRSYAIECLRRGYWNNRFEVEARAFADRHTARLWALLRDQTPAADERSPQPSSASRS